ncbi:hypothetical protein BDP27DRAFT_1404234 [Rhodocollybia butyracea]|uniref:Fungal-type protein kinase domain-containing protein n=1 Tax=Rhodocollybia butyracea TaxID=206335 RepID=A0A9P5PMU4_9AGAR|nr:hypothetical protein BDP27DRAFT_1404234 [Rhodocollybia butyracea]
MDDEVESLPSPDHVTASGDSAEPGQETSLSPFRSSSSMDPMRDSVLKILPSRIPELAVEDFCIHILPLLPGSSEGKMLGHVLETLKQDGVLKDQGWAAFLQEPAARSEHETVVYKPMADIFRAVVAAEKEHDRDALEPTFNFTMPHSDLGPASRPDFIFEHISLKSAHTANPEGKGKARQGVTEEEQLEAPRSYLFDHHTVPVQVKKLNQPSNANENVWKVFDNMSTLLRMDPCRRFTFGITVENYDMRVWFLSRANLVKSQPFNFMEQPELLVQLFLSFAFASPSKMGWDPTFSFSHIHDGHRQYIIEVEGKVYTTISIISDSSANSPFGRGTRIWKVQDSEGKIHVLKDLWLSFDTVPENQILMQIIEDIRNLDNDSADKMAEAVRKRTLTPLACCKVAVDGQVDDTRTVMMGGYDLAGQPMIDSFTAQAPAYTSLQSVASSLLSDREHPSQSLASEFTTVATSNHKQPVHSRRYHYRIVFKQYATTIYNERNLGNIINGLSEVVLALRFIHMAGWVHRDISGGNLYWCSEQNTGLIGDFEYSRKVTDEDETHLQGRVGTPQFMACEIIYQSYLFDRRKVERPEPIDESRKIDIFDWHSFKDLPDLPIAPPIKHPVFAYNALHDLESVWWILLWVLFSNEDASHAAPNRTDRQAWIDKVFNGGSQNGYRLSFFMHHLTSGVVPEYVSPTFEPAFIIISNFSHFLRCGYHHAEENYPDIEPLAFESVHNRCLQALQAKKLLAVLSQITLVPVRELAQVEAARGKKRSNTSFDSQPQAKKSKYVFESRRIIPATLQLYIPIAQFATHHHMDKSTSRIPGNGRLRLVGGDGYTRKKEGWQALQLQDWQRQLSLGFHWLTQGARVGK